MSIKKRHLYDMAWHKLVQACHEVERPVTAGEYARYMGIARSTAQRWLADMMAQDAVFSYRNIGKNGYPVTTYAPNMDGVR